MENLTYGEINERNFSNPHPWLARWLVYKSQIMAYICRIQNLILLR